MTKDETIAAITLLKSNWKSSLDKLTQDQKREMVEQWHQELSKYDYATVCNAVSTVSRNAKFFPTIKEIVHEISNIKRTTYTDKRCNICDNSGLIPYSKPYDYGGSVGIQDVVYMARCSCNADVDSKVLTYQEVFGFAPQKPQSTGSISISDIRKEYMRWINANTKK